MTQRVSWWDEVAGEGASGEWRRDEPRAALGDRSSGGEGMNRE